MSHRFISLSMLGAMALSAAPLAGAQDAEQPSSELRKEIHQALRACRDHDTRQEVKECISDLRERFQNAFPGRNNVKRKIADRLNIPEEAREALKACREDNAEHEDMKACAQNVASQYGFELPDHGGKRHKGKQMRRDFREDITEACGQRQDTDEWKECLKENRKDAFANVREDYPQGARRLRNMRHRFHNLDDDTKNELKECRQLETREAKRACFNAVRNNLDSQ